MTSPLQGLLEMEAMREGKADKVLRSEVKGMHFNLCRGAAVSDGSKEEKRDVWKGRKESGRKSS